MWASSVVLYPSPAFLAAMSVLPIVSGVYLGLSELRGEHMAYSKFWHVVVSAGSSGQKRAPAAADGALLPSRSGMLLAYAPALVAAAASFAVPGAVEGLRAELLAGALALHFLKRVLEVLFIHRYSGSMTLNTALTISSGYLLTTAAMIYGQHLTVGLSDPSTDLLYPGMLVFALGIVGNFYHHYLLSRLRKRSDVGADIKGYKIPRGGLFEFIACPHYLFEIVIFLGFAMISQTVYALAVAFGSAAYLAGRSCATRRWYVSKFEEFPPKMKALVPFIF